ncbi:ABC transporter substrate-binding protein [Alteromonas sediminis]|nr:ABC transporter substrate-binding protein [Alteromonas sediminis]
MASHATSVMFVSPSTPDDPFFSRVELFIRMAAENLGFDLTVIYGEAHRIYQQQELEQYLAKEQPDYMLVQVYAGSGKALFELLDKYPTVKVISLEHLLLNHETEEVGKPGEIYKNWIAELTFDNVSASETLSRYLLKACEQEARTDRWGIVGVNGLHGQEALQRHAGLVEAVNRTNLYELHQVVNAKWQRELAQKQVRTLLSRYPKTSVIWSASDWMALGVADAIEPLKRTGQRFCIGGFDWIPEIVDAIQANRISASIGGHFMLGAWAMVMVYDHIKGVMPRDINSDNPILNLQLMHAGNLQEIAPLLERQAWKNVDFRQYSLFYNDQHQDYQFRLPLSDPAE